MVHPAQSLEAIDLIVPTMNEIKPRLFTIIDDDVDDRELFAIALKEVASDIICNECDCPEEFLYKMKQSEIPDVIFLDINMPRIDGYKLLSIIRNDDRFADATIVMYSTTIQSKDRARAKSLGADTFITKTNTYQQLCHALQSFIKTFLMTKHDQILSSRKQIQESRTMIHRANAELNKLGLISLLNKKF